MINSQNFSKAVAKALQVNAAKPLLIEQGQLYTYEALDKYSTLIAAELDILGVGLGSRVILCCQRGVKLAAMMLACARLGAVYMPVDKSYPNARIQLICQQFSHQLFITDTPAECEFSHAIDLDKMWEMVNLQQPGDHSFCCTTLPLIDDGLPLYVNFSSGSTGKPKAILVKRQGVYNLCTEQALVGLDPDDNVAWASNIAFDATTWEFWGTLLNGGVISVYSNSFSCDDFAAFLMASNVNTLWLTAALFKLTVRSNITAFAKIRRLLVGGDIVPVNEVCALYQSYPDITIINGYGPTENTVFSLAYEIPATINNAQRNIPIGTPIKGVNFLIDSHADEEFGELLLTGQGLAAGYLNDDALNQTQFVTIQDDKETALYYRTGDLVAVKDGLVYFQGRVDNQTKINGYRVDLGELEMVACQCDDIKDSVAVVVADEWKFIALVVHGIGSHELSILKAFLAEKLPFYMLPKLILATDEFKLNVHGKVDRKKITALVQEQLLLEEPLARCLLACGVKSDDDLGWDELDSLARVNLESQLNAILAVTMPIRELMQFSSYRLLSEKLSLMTENATNIKAKSEQTATHRLAPNAKRFLSMFNVNINHTTHALTVEVNCKNQQHLQSTLLKLIEANPVLNCHLLLDGCELIWQPFSDVNLIDIFVQGGPIAFNLLTQRPIKIVCSGNSTKVQIYLHRLVSDATTADIVKKAFTTSVNTPDEDYLSFSERSYLFSKKLSTQSQSFWLTHLEGIAPFYRPNRIREGIVDVCKVSKINTTAEKIKTAYAYAIGQATKRDKVLICQPYSLRQPIHQYAIGFYPIVVPTVIELNSEFMQTQQTFHKAMSLSLRHMQGDVDEVEALFAESCECFPLSGFYMNHIVDFEHAVDPHEYKTRPSYTEVDLTIIEDKESFTLMFVHPASKLSCNVLAYIQELLTDKKVQVQSVRL